jgi:hypothetical protein
MYVNATLSRNTGAASLSLSVSCACQSRRPITAIAGPSQVRAQEAAPFVGLTSRIAARHSTGVQMHTTASIHAPAVARRLAVRRRYIPLKFHSLPYAFYALCAKMCNHAAAWRSQKWLFVISVVCGCCCTLACIVLIVQLHGSG